jgi:hypothetical protein
MAADMQLEVLISFILCMGLGISLSFIVINELTRTMLYNRKLLSITLQILKEGNFETMAELHGLYASHNLQPPNIDHTYLMSRSDDPSMPFPTTCGVTMLAIAILRGNMELVQTLIRLGADVNMINIIEGNFLTCLDICSDPHISKILIDHGAKCSYETSMLLPWHSLELANTDYLYELYLKAVSEANYPLLCSVFNTGLVSTENLYGFHPMWWLPLFCENSIQKQDSIIACFRVMLDYGCNPHMAEFTFPNNPNRSLPANMEYYLELSFDQAKNIAFFNSTSRNMIWPWEEAKDLNMVIAKKNDWETHRQLIRTVLRLIPIDF